MRGSAFGDSHSDASVAVAATVVRGNTPIVAMAMSPVSAVTVDPGTGRKPSMKQRTRASSRLRLQRGGGVEGMNSCFTAKRSVVPGFVDVSVTVFVVIHSLPPAVATAGAAADTRVVAAATERVVIFATAAGTNVATYPTAAMLVVAVTAFDTAATADVVSLDTPIHRPKLAVFHYLLGGKGSARRGGEGVAARRCRACSCTCRVHHILESAAGDNSRPQPNR